MIRCSQAMRMEFRKPCVRSDMGRSLIGRRYTNERAGNLNEALAVIFTLHSSRRCQWYDDEIWDESQCQDAYSYRTSTESGDGKRHSSIASEVERGARRQRCRV